MGCRIHQPGSLAESAFHLKTPQTKFTLVVVDTWTTRFSDDNRCGWYCDHPDANYYTIGITNRLLNPSTIMAYVVQLHNGIYRLMFHVSSVFNCFCFECPPVLSRKDKNRIYFELVNQTLLTSCHLF